MAEELRVVITAKDGASRVFKEVGTAAKGVGDEAEKAGEKGERGFKRVGDSAKNAKVDAAALGVALTAVGAALSYAGAMAMQQERQLIGLNRAFGENADAVIRYAEELDNITIFSDDDIRAGQRYFATLQNNYDMSIDQIKQLMATTAELAAASGTSFEDASSRVTAAIRGEGEAAEYLNLTMNQQAIDRDNLTLKMTNQEAAQYRLNALLEQSAPYMGTNNDLMDTSIGKVAEWNDRMQDLGASVGGLIGPFGSLATGFGSMGLGLTGLATGFGLLNKSIATVRASMATGLLAGAMTPMGLAVTGLGIGIGLLTTAFMQNRKEAAEAQAVIATLKDAYLDLRVAADAAGDSGDVATEARLNQLRHQVESVRAESDLIVKTMEDTSQFKLFGKDYDRDDWFELKDAYEITDEEAKSLADSQAKLGAAMQDSTIDAEALSKAQGDLYNQFIRQEITADQFTVQLAHLADNTDQYTLATDDASRAQQAWNAAMADGMLGARDLGTLANVAVNGIDNLRRGYRDATDASDETTAAQDRMNAAIVYFDWLISGRHTTNVDMAISQAVELAAAMRQVNDTGFGVGASANTFITPFVEDMKLLGESLTTILELTGNADITSQLNMTQAASEASILAENITDAAGAIDNLFRAIVGNTNALGSQMQGIKDWSDDLIGDPGVWAEIDDLYNEGRISLEKYNEAQQAQVEITGANATIQRDLLAIQAAQAPIIAAGATGLADYVEELRQMNDGFNDTATGAQDQLAALALMDSGYQNQLLQVMQLADQLDDLGPSGEAAFRTMIDGMVALDPAMAAVLETVGYIDNVVRDDSGRVLSYDVSINGADGAMSEIEMLNGSIVDLIDVLDDGKLNGSYTMTFNAEDNASDVIRTVRSERDELDGSSATVSIYANDFATLGINAAASALSMLDGRVATTTVRTVYESQGLGYQMANGGVVQGYADGGVVIRAGEVSPEILHFANGGTAVLPYDGLYHVPVGSYISPGHASTGNIGSNITVDFSGAVFNNTSRDEMNMWAESSLVPSLVSVLNDERRGQVR